MELIAAIAGSLMVSISVWIERRTYSRSCRLINLRRSIGDNSCGIKRTFYGWRVIEYAESCE